MALISLEFLGFCLLLAVVYYLVPGKLQNTVLLAANVCFLLPLTYGGAAIVSLGIGILSVYAAARILRMSRGTVWQKLVFHGTVVLNLSLLFLYKYLPCVEAIFSPLGVTVKASELTAMAPLGISFYTLQLLSYLIGVNDGGLEAETNLLRFAVFGSYFPQLTSGPIARYEEMAPQLMAPRRLCYRNLTQGAQRMLWGFFKKLVISERAAVPANAVFGNYGVYDGFYIPVGAAMFAVQLYTDFSGCMDIVLGMSQILGIELPENFRSPFFSQSMTEFWRRWHITLGSWCRDYVFYPLQKTELFSRLRERSVKRFGRKKGKKLPMYLAMFLMWFTVGFWHGGYLKYIIGSGLLHFCYIVIGQEGAPLWNRVNTLLHIRTESAGHRAFRRIRTFLLACSGFVFFRAESTAEAVHMYRAAFRWNPVVFSLNGLEALGLDLPDLMILLVGILLLAFVEALQQRAGIREMLAEQSLPVRWILLLALFYAVIILGQYGPGFDAESFIYAAF